MPRRPHARCRSAGRLLLSQTALCLLLSCSQGGSGNPSGAADTASSAVSSASAAPSDSAGEIKPKEKDEEVKPLYPIDNSPPDPLAVRFCETMHDLEAKRRGECCASPGATGYFTAECSRVVSAAIRLSSIKLDAARVDACAAAATKALEGCGWVGAASPDLPAECETVIAGQLEEKAVCRSSLECAPSLTCQGLTTTRAGKCLPPRPAGLICGGSVDTLAALTRQNKAAERHRECAGYCARPLCADAVPLGGVCKTDVECGASLRCSGGKCSNSPLPPAGKPCDNGQCAQGARCLQGTCAAPKEEGQPCGADPECLGACDKAEGAAAGKCKKTCPVTKLPTKPAFEPKGAPSAKGAASAKGAPPK